MSLCEKSNAFVTDASHPYRIDGNGVTTCTGCGAFALAEPLGIGDWLRIRPHKRLVRVVVP